VFVGRRMTVPVHPNGPARFIIEHDGARQRFKASVVPMQTQDRFGRERTDTGTCRDDLPKCGRHSGRAKAIMQVGWFGSAIQEMGSINAPYERAVAAQRARERRPSSA
jgi:hypothetical protein